MESITVRGGRRLTGEVRVEGAKNSALKLMAASIMAPGVCRISNVPDIADVDIMSQVLEALGARVARTDHALEIDATTISSHEAPYEFVAQMRASTAVLGPLVARLGEARVAMPGGCNIGSRKIDMHLRGLQALGVRIDIGHGYIHATAPEGGRPLAANVTLDFASVGATENLLMASVLARGYHGHRERGPGTGDRRSDRVPQLDGRTCQRRGDPDCDRRGGRRTSALPTTEWSATASRRARTSWRAPSPAVP